MVDGLARCRWNCSERRFDLDPRKTGTARVFMVLGPRRGAMIQMWRCKSWFKVGESERPASVRGEARIQTFSCASCKATVRDCAFRYALHLGDVFCLFERTCWLTSVRELRIILLNVHIENCMYISMFLQKGVILRTMCSHYSMIS